MLVFCLFFGVIAGSLTYFISNKQLSSNLPPQIQPLSLPVANASDYWIKDGTRPQFDRLQLPENSEIKAVFAGTVTHVGPVEQNGGIKSQNIILHNPQTKQGASYLLPDNAQILVDVDQQVAAGQALARLLGGGQNLDCLGEANVSITYLLDGEIIPVDERRYR